MLREALYAQKFNEKIITEPNLASVKQNAERYTTFQCYRNGYFSEDPQSARWRWAELSPQESGSLRYVDYSYWDEMSDHTHLVKVAATNIKAGRVVFAVSNDLFWSVIKVIDAEQKLPPLIVRSAHGKGPDKLLEGHLRATAYSLATHPPKVIKAIVGFNHA